MRVLQVVAVLLALQAGAAPKVSLLKFTGPRAPQARTALAAVLCKRVECVEPELVTTRFVADWEKAKAQSVSFMVEGTAARIPGTVELTVQLLENGQPLASQKVEVPKEGMTDAALSKLSDALMAVIEPVVAPPPPKIEPVVVKPVEKPVQAAPEVVVVTPPAPARKATGQYTFAGELGLNAYNRSFDYVGGFVPSLRSYSLPLVALINARLEWFPLAAREGLWRGLGVEVAGNVAPWIRSAPPNTTNSLPTFTSRTDVAAQLRMPMGALVIAPLLGVRLHTFTIMGTTADGAQIDGMPNLVYVAVRAGVGGEFRINDRFLAFARVAALPLLSSGQLISAAYFPRGGAVGIEATGGAGMKLFPGVEVRLSFDWTRYMFWFDTNIATSKLYARGAFDQYLGATAMVRFEL